MRDIVVVLLLVTACGRHTLQLIGEQFSIAQFKSETIRTANQSTGTLKLSLIYVL